MPEKADRKTRFNQFRVNRKKEPPAYNRRLPALQQLESPALISSTVGSDQKGFHFGRSVNFK